MIRRFLSIAVVALVLLLSERSFAFAELNVFYLSDALTISTSNTSSRMFIEGAIGFAVDKKKKYNIGWAYAMHSAQDKKTATEKYSATQMGPRFLYVIDKNGAWTIGVGYYLVSKAKYNDGIGSEPEWKGSAIKVDAGYNFPLAENFFAGIRMNYSAASYNEQLVQSTTYSNVSYKRTLIYPSLYSVFMF